MARIRQSLKNKPAYTAALALGLAAGAAPQAFALDSGMPDTAIFARAPEISDSALSHMRGRFISQGQIVQFGVEMISQWTNPQTGQVLTAGANINVTNLQAGSPQISFQPNLTIATAIPVPVNGTAVQVAGGNGIQNVSGVGQSIQIAGDSNGAVNNAAITITTDPIPGGQGSGGGMQTVTAANGATVSATAGNGGVGVSIRMPNQGVVLQHISGGSLNGGAGSGAGLVQMVQATGSMQQIQNTMNLRIQLSSLASLASQSNFNQTLSTLQGIQAFQRH